MQDRLHVRAAEVTRLATTVRSNPDQAEALIPVVNRQLAELAAMGVEDLQVEGPAIYSRPQGLSIGKTNDHSVYEAVVVMPGGVGTVLWNSTEFDDSMNRPYGEPFDLAPRFVEFD
jgi:hypothetical protein